MARLGQIAENKFNKGLPLPTESWSLPALSALPLKLPSSTAVTSPLLLLGTVLRSAQSPLNRRHGCFKSTRVKKTTPCKHKSKESRSGCINASMGFQARLLLGQRVPRGRGGQCLRRAEQASAGAWLGNVQVRASRERRGEAAPREVSAGGHCRTPRLQEQRVQPRNGV